MLIREILDGKIESFDVLYNKYSKKIFNFLFRMTKEEYLAEDIMQEVFIKVYKNLEKFKFKSAFYTWLYRIAFNTALTHLKKRKRLKEKEYTEETLHSQTDNLEKFDNIIDTKSLEIVLNKLPDKQRHVFNLRFFDKLKFSELADVLQISENSAKTNFHYAMQKIKKELEAVYEKDN
jgi:RNA polymerase sigma-70 factor (ECF subfamily)